MRRTMLLLTLTSLVLIACAAGEDATSISGPQVSDSEEITLMSHDSFAISEAVLAKFEQDNNAEIILLPAGDAGAALNQAILSKDDPLADLFFGVDNSFMSRALDAGIFQPYDSPELANVAEELKLDPSNRLLPVDYGDVCLNYDKAWFSERGLRPPQALIDLTQEEYRGLTVVENPATSSPGLAFLLATLDTFGTEGDYTYLDYWREVRANDVLVTDGWEAAYFGQFSAASDGDRPIVVSYASSPPAEVVFADPPVDEAPTASVTGPGTCFRQVEFVGILNGTMNRELAESFVDFMLSETFQEDIPLNMFVFPANQKATLPEVFIQWAAVPNEPATVDPFDIDANREEWIEAWTEVVLR